MSPETNNFVAIIGSGLAGLGLALALHAQGIPCTVYELRGPTYDYHGAIMLSPNSLRILDKFGVYSRIRSKGFSFENVVIKTGNGETTDLYTMGNERLYGYKALRIYRRILVNELQEMAIERGIEIKFAKKYTRIVSEDDSGVSFAFADGSVEHASLLIGTDGIYSRIRSTHVAPNVVPKYSGFVAITYAVPRSQLRIPANEDLCSPVTWSGRHGAFVLAPQDVDGREFLAGKQIKFPEQTREGWDKLFRDREQLLSLIRRGKEDELDIVQSALENIHTDSFIIWPFYIVPRIEKWISEAGRVIIMGDAAHAIPPTAGQGANQAFEDAYTLAMLLSKIETPSSGLGSKDITIEKAINFWQSMRQERVDQVIQLTSQLNNMRLPTAEKEKLDKESVWHEDKSQPEGSQMSWLFMPELEKCVEEWFEQQ